MSDYVYSPKVDSNHADVRRWYEALYCSVVDTHKVPGFGDFVVGIANSVNDIVEVKTEDGRLKAGQASFHRDWRGRKVVVVRTQADVVNHVQNVREWVSRGNHHAGHNE